MDAAPLAKVHRFFIPNSGLYLADVRAADEQHAEPRLADAAAHRERHFAREQRLVERQLPAVVAPGERELAVHALGADADAHGGNLKRAVEHGVAEDNIAVQVPVIVVGGAPVVLLAGAERFADLHDKAGRVRFGVLVLALGGREIGIHVLQLLTRDEGYVAAQMGAQLREFPFQLVAGHADGRYDAPHGVLEIVEIAVLLADDLFPVPLVHIDRVDIVEHRLVAPDGVHIGVKALALIEVILAQRPALPLCQRLYDLALRAVHGGDIEGDRTFDAVQVIVQAGIGAHEQRRGYALEIQRRAQILLKAPLDKFDGSLRLVDVQPGRVPLGNDAAAHVYPSL